MPTIKKFKTCRYLGANVFEQCQSPAFINSQAKKAKASRQGRPKRKTQYGLALIGKQRVRVSYGVREKQFRNYVINAIKKSPKGVKPADFLAQQLERRFDNTVYRAGFAHTRAFARQLVTHGHFTVNGRRLDVPSYQVKEGDVIEIREGSKNRTVFNEIGKKLHAAKQPAWLSLDDKKLTVTVTGTPVVDEPILNFQGVIEFYSR